MNMIGKFLEMRSFMMVLAVGLTAYAQQAYFGYVETPVNPRSIAMGSSGTAGGNGGFSFYNPAAIATIDSSFVAFEYGRQWGDLSAGLVETAWLFPKWFIGASFQTQSNDFEVTDDFGNRLSSRGTEQASVLSLQIGWKSGRYAVGASVNGLQHHLFHSNAYGVSASGGAVVTILPKKLIAGISVIQAGGYYSGFYMTQFEVNRRIMPAMGRIGLGWNDTVIGRLPVTLFLDAVYSSNFHTVMIPAGVEIRPLHALAIRLGKRFNHETELLTTGVGIYWENLAFDASFIPYTLQGDLESKWLIGLRYSLAAKKKSPRSEPPSSSEIKSGRSSGGSTRDIIQPADEG